MKPPTPLPTRPSGPISLRGAAAPLSGDRPQPSGAPTGGDGNALGRTMDRHLNGVNDPPRPLLARSELSLERRLLDYGRAFEDGGEVGDGIRTNLPRPVSEVSKGPAPPLELLRISLGFVLGSPVDVHVRYSLNRRRDFRVRGSVGAGRLAAGHVPPPEIRLACGGRLVEAAHRRGGRGRMQ